jgi:hypothetical protein
MSSPPFDARWVDSLFERLVAMYGSQKVAAMWSGAPIDMVKQTWADQLSRFPAATIGAALQKLVDSGDGWPPTLPEFVEACRQCALGRRQQGAALVAPGQSFTDAETAKANLAKVRELLRAAIKVVE